MVVNFTGDNSTIAGNRTGNYYPPPHLMNIVILGILIPLILFGNSLVCILFLKYQRLRTATNCFIFSLAISDLMVGLMIIPLWITFSFIGYDKEPTLFMVYIMLDIICSVASITNLASVSMERWYGVSYPFLHMRMTTKKASLMATGSWFYAISVALLFLIDTSFRIIVISTLGLIVPFVTMVISYTGIAFKIRKKTTTPCRQSGREWKTIRTLLLITCIFLICYLPFIVGSITTTYCNRCRYYVDQTPLLHTFLKVLHFSNSSVNPIIYAMCSPSFKTAYKQLFCGVKNARGARVKQHGRLSLDPTTNTGLSMTRKSHIVHWNSSRRNSSLPNTRDQIVPQIKDCHL